MARQRPVQKGDDFLHLNMGRVYATLDNGNRYHLFNIKELTIELAQENSALGRLDHMMKAHMVVSLEGTFSGTAYSPTSMFMDLANEMKNTNVINRFEIQARGEDPNSKVGIQEVILRDCLIDSYQLLALNADGGQMEEPLNGTFDDYVVVEQYGVLDGMQR